eukprot:TRINITY_DN14572_c0_g1_i1.p1 TRINITY_DN14572_c0_g1~~TRINITY_DN14572_c0_g1_i1.p1  ORF type:complete len:322 (+),score=79.52 TRINITY_DN14572_c0_g1_i1:98-1063(+)
MCIRDSINAEYGDIQPSNMRSWAKSSPFKNDILSDRTALITGGGSGIGFEIARQLGLHGANLCLMGRRPDALQKAVDSLKAEGVSVIFYAGDVRDPNDCAKAVRTAQEVFGQLNVVVNSAAGMFPASMGESMSPNGFKTVMDIDVLGTYNTCFSALDALKQSGKGMVINVTVPPHFASGSQWWVGHMQSAKAAITTMSHTMAKEWAEYGIRVANVGPGSIADTPAQLKYGNKEGLSAEASELTADGIPVADYVPLGRMGTSFECAMAAVFLCVSEYITAETIVVDGGWWLGADKPAVPREMLNAVTRKNEAGSRALLPSKM